MNPKRTNQTEPKTKNPNPKTKNTNPKLNWYISPQRWAIFQFVGLDTMVLRSQWMLLGVPVAIWHATFFSLSHSPSLSLPLALPTLCFFTNLCVIFLRLFFNKFFIVCLSEQKKGSGERGEKSKLLMASEHAASDVSIKRFHCAEPFVCPSLGQVVLFW